ncbi:MAG: hypothetical protein AAF570_09720 [Bacteroidota bacterium]
MEENKNQLHRLLAVETERRNTASRIIDETITTFAKKDHHFDGQNRLYVPSEEGGEEFPPENREIVTSVKEKLDHAVSLVVKGINAHISKEETNASGAAHAMLDVDGTKFGKLSATSLLALEGHLKGIRKLYLNIPTLDPVRKWTFDPTNGRYESGPEVKFRSVKRPKVVVKYEATKEHPAQTELFSEDVRVGKWETLHLSGKLTPTDKSRLLARIDQLISAVKVARAEANMAEVAQSEVGNKLFDFIHKGILD